MGQRDKGPEVSLWENPSMIYEILEQALDEEVLNFNGEIIGNDHAE